MQNALLTFLTADCTVSFVSREKSATSLFFEGIAAGRKGSIHMISFEKGNMSRHTFCYENAGNNDDINIERIREIMRSPSEKCHLYFDTNHRHINHILHAFFYKIVIIIKSSGNIP